MCTLTQKVVRLWTSLRYLIYIRCERRNYRESLLKSACGSGNLDLVRFLVDQGANVSDEIGLIHIAVYLKYKQIKIQHSVSFNYEWFQI